MNTLGVMATDEVKWDLVGVDVVPAQWELMRISSIWWQSSLSFVLPVYYHAITKTFLQVEGMECN